MIVFLIILAIVIFIIYLFQSDKKQALQKNIAHGGLKAKYPNFVLFCFDKEFVKDTGRYLEYRKAIDDDARIKVYFHYGLQDVFGTSAYCYAVSTNGYQTKKLMTEIKKPMIGFEIEFDEYEVL